MYTCIPSVRTLHVHNFVYPGQPVVLTGCIVQLYDSPESAGALTAHGWCEVESNSHIPGAGGQASKAVQALMQFRQHGSLEQLMVDLEKAWWRSVRPGSGNHEEKYEIGYKLAAPLIPILMDVLPTWFAGQGKVVGIGR